MKINKNKKPVKETQENIVSGIDLWRIFSSLSPLGRNKAELILLNILRNFVKI